MAKELRQFVYLDDDTVRSLLASYSIAAPQTVKEKTEQIREGSGGANLGFGFNVPYVGRVDAEADVSASKTAKDAYEVNKRINNQYVFNVLYEALNEDDQITDYTDGPGQSTSLSKGDVVKIEGQGKTGAIYRLLSLFAMAMDLSDQDSDREQVEKAREIAYGNQIGLSIDVKDSSYVFGMGLDTEKFLTDEEREFFGSREYIVIGRVRETIDGSRSWDYADLMRLGETIVSDETMTEIRELLSNFANSIGGLEQAYQLPNLDSATVDDLQNEDFESTESMFELDIQDDEVSLSGPGYVIDPVAIYW